MRGKTDAMAEAGGIPPISVEKMGTEAEHMLNTHDSSSLAADEAIYDRSFNTTSSLINISPHQESS
jgi:hypothetical protein